MVIGGEQITVTAQAEGQMAAINQQLSARTITNVVSSARIQELPDANAAESVGKLPGVAILRSGGEGNKVIIRGLSPQYNNIKINGVKMDTYIDWMKSCYFITVTGLPAISVPCGFTPEGLPVGMQIVGRHNDDFGVLQIAHAFEQATGMWKHRPPEME